MQDDAQQDFKSLPLDTDARGYLRELEYSEEEQKQIEEEAAAAVRRHERAGGEELRYRN